MQKKISIIVALIGIIIMSISSFGVTLSTGGYPGDIISDKTSYNVGDTIHWTASNLEIGTYYTVSILLPSASSAPYMMDVDSWTATTATRSGTITVASDMNGANAVQLNYNGNSMTVSSHYNFNVGAVTSSSTTTTTLAGSATIIVTLLDSNNHPVPYYSIIFCTNVVPHLDSYSSNTANDGTAKFKNLDGTATYKVSGKNTNSVTVSFSSPTQIVLVTLHINPATTTPTSTTSTSTSSSASTTTTHPTTTTTTMITSTSTSITGTQTMTTIITKTETITSTTTPISTNELYGIPYLTLFGAALIAIGFIGFVTSKEQKI